MVESLSWLPLKGKRQGEWILELERLIKLEKETELKIEESIVT